MAELLSLACSGLFACRRPYFSLLRQRKVSKRKASQRPCPFGVPCATRIARGRAQTRCAQTSARPHPVAAALLSTAYGKWGSACCYRWGCSGSSSRNCSRNCNCIHHLSHSTNQSRNRSRAAPGAKPFTATASSTNPGEQTRTATSRTNTPIKIGKNQIGCSSSPSPQPG